MYFYCRKLNGTYQLKNMWNEWQTVTENTMLLNESMVKLAKYYDANQGENMSTYKESPLLLTLGDVVSLILLDIWSGRQALRCV